MKLLLRICCIVGTLLAVLAAASLFLSPSSDIADTVGSGNSSGIAADADNDSNTILVGTCEAVTVERVVDGDTILLDDGNYVRLIGIDAPESVHPDESRNSEEGTVSSDFLKSVLSAGDTVYLEYDEEAYDRYGRILAYVWTCDMTGEEVGIDEIQTYMLQGIILDAGMAEAKVYEPNDKYADFFDELSAEGVG